MTRPLGELFWVTFPAESNVSDELTWFQVASWIPRRPVQPAQLTRGKVPGFVSVQLTMVWVTRPSESKNVMVTTPVGLLTAYWRPEES